jgi:SAM-dependent methyltransferase
MIDSSYFECPTCGALVKDSKYFLTPQQEKERYELHNNDVDDVRYQKFTSCITNAVLENQHKDHLGLDFGCGTGPVIAKQLKEKGYQVVLYDPYFYPDQDYLNHQYDYIYSCEVFEHFYNPKKEIEKLLSLLRNQGRLYIMTHVYRDSIDFQHWYYKNDGTHVFIYSEKTIAYISTEFNLSVETQTDRFILFKKNE